MAAAGRLERVAIALLRGVGGDHEWWLWNSGARIGHLRVPLTPQEYAATPPGCVVGDAGSSGQKRRRSP